MCPSPRKANISKIVVIYDYVYSFEGQIDGHMKKKREYLSAL